MISSRQNTLRSPVSFWALTTVLLLVLATAIACFPANIISYDTFGYYLYLPQIFIYNDLGFSNIEQIQSIIATYENSGTLYQIWQTETGNWLIRYTSGQAVLFSPFFLLAHAYTLLSGGVADGFSLPYQIALFGGCLCYFVVAMFLLRRILLHFFSDRIAALTLVLLVLGTNLFANAAFATAGIHSQLFFLYTLLILFTIRWHENPAWKNIMPIAVVCGLIIITRPTDIICLLIPLLWKVWDKETLVAKWRLCKEKFPQILVSAIIIGLIGSVQLLYWKTYSGHWLIDSYNNPGEGLDFLHPHIAQTLFSFRKGWFIYTPMMLIACFGFIPLWRRRRDCFWPLFTFVVLNIYLVSCWSCWWYAGSFGHRAYVQSYAILSIPFGFALLALSEKRNLVKIPFFILTLLFLILNLFQTWQFRKKIISASDMTRAAYLANFFQTDVTKCNRSLLMVWRDPSGIETMDTSRHYTEHFLIKESFGTEGFQTDSTIEFSPAVRIPYKEITKKDHAWMRIRCEIMPCAPVSENPGYFTVTFQHNEKNYKYRTFPLSDSLLVNQWNTIEVLYLTPEIRTRNDELVIYYWHQGKQPVRIRNVEVWASTATTD